MGRVLPKRLDVAEVDGRLTLLEDNEKIITYYEVVQGTSSGNKVTPPANGIILLDRFGASKDAVLSEVDGNSKPTWGSPRDAGGNIVTTSMAVDGTYLFSSQPVDITVAVIYSFRIKVINYPQVNLNNIVSEDELELSAEQVKGKYESNADTNAYTDLEKSKLAGIEPLAQVNKITETWRAGRNSNTTSNLYLRDANGVPTNQGPFTVGRLSTIRSIEVTTRTAVTWIAEIRVDTGAGFVVVDTLSIVNSDNGNKSTSIALSVGDRVGLYCNGSSITKPAIKLIVEEN